MLKLRELLINWCGLASLKNLENCTQLRVIKANHNYFDKIPDWIGNLNQLEVLELDGNFFPGKAVPHINSIPSTIGKLTELKILSVNDQLIKVLPNEIGQLKNLEVLHIRNNQLEQFPVSIKECNSLKELDIKANLITTLPDLNSLKNLSELNISFNDYLNLNEEAGKFQNLTNLKTLDISYLKASTETIKAIKESLPNVFIIYKTYDDLQFNPDKKP